MSSTGSITSASNIQMDFMTLLTTQLQNQNPLEPLDNNQMAMQLAQFSELAQLENMNSSFAQALDTAQQNYASSLIGKKISFLQQATDGTLEQDVGIVDTMIKDTDGAIYLSVGEQAIPLDGVLTIAE